MGTRLLRLGGLLMRLLSKTRVAKYGWELPTPTSTENLKILGIVYSILQGQSGYRFTPRVSCGNASYILHVDNEALQAELLEYNNELKGV